MKTKRVVILDAERLIKTANDSIEENIDVLCPDHIGLCAQNILNQLRNLIEAFALLEYGKDNPFLDGETNQQRLSKAISSFKDGSNSKRFAPFKELHDYIQMVASHYTQDQFCSLSLLEKYSELIHEVKVCAKREFGKDILNNINKFPFEMTDELKSFYLAVFEILEKRIDSKGKTSTFYIEKKRKRYVSNDAVLFEYVLSPANDKKTKFDRLTAFSLFNIDKTHSVECTIATANLTISNIKTTISIIKSHSIRIRPCELKLFAALERFNGFPKEIKRKTPGYIPLMTFLDENSMTIYDLIKLDNSHFEEALESIKGLGNENAILEFLRYTREKLNKRELGFKTLTYLLYTFRHAIMKSQKKSFYYDDNGLGDTELSDGCALFEELPFSFSLKKHNPQLGDLIECLGEFSTPDQLLKGKVLINTENNKELFTPIEELDKHYLTQDYIELYNSRLPTRKKNNSLMITPNGKYVYLKNFVDDTKRIISYLKRKSLSGYSDYSALADNYLKENPDIAIDDSKKDLLKKALANSSVAIINGAAGTGKTTTIIHLSRILESEKVLFLSCTNSSVQNLRRKVGTSGSRLKMDFKTVESFLSKTYSVPSFYSAVVIDECSTLSNRDFCKIIEKKDFDMLILVGDEEQIESINFGNWFGVAKCELGTCSFELSDNHRTDEPNIRTIWGATRDCESRLYESLEIGGFVSGLNNSIFEKTMEDEVILCLNYDGFYGINNINRYMQEKNEGEEVSWGVWSFKKGDKILFNGNYTFKDYFYNNQKGIIEDIQDLGDKVVFQVNVPKEESNNHSFTSFVSYIGSDDKYDRYEIVIDKKDDDDDEESIKVLNVPFQLGYALSIHKSQGLEHDSVKVVFTKEIEEAITHNVFYTAITRCKKKLQIFCDSKSLNNILNGFKKTDYYRDSCLIKTV